jgi:hypothetical protein
MFRSEAISDVRKLLNDNNLVLQKMVNQSQALRADRASTISGKDIEFDFDDQLISSPAYRRAFNSFVHHSKQSDSKVKEPRNSDDGTEVARSEPTLLNEDNAIENAQVAQPSGIVTDNPLQSTLTMDRCQ